MYLRSQAYEHHPRHPLRHSWRNNSCGTSTIESGLSRANRLLLACVENLENGDLRASHRPVDVSGISLLLLPNTPLIRPDDWECSRILAQLTSRLLVRPIGIDDV